MAAGLLFRVAIPLAVWLGVWQLASWWVGRDLLLPSPASVAACLVELGQTGEFWLSAVSTLARVVCGLVGGVVLGTLLAFLTHFSTWGGPDFLPRHPGAAGHPGGVLYFAGLLMGGPGQHSRPHRGNDGAPRGVGQPDGGA